MNYSTAHLRLSRDSNSIDVLTDPQDFLGPNYETVINFWWTMDSFTKDQWNEVNNRYRVIDFNTWHLAARLASSAAKSAVKDLIRISIGDVVMRVGGYAASYATYELFGMHKLFEQGDSLTFVPLFDFTGNYEFQSLDVKEIETRIQRINDFIGPKVEVENDATMTAEDLKSFIEDVELFD